MKTNPEITDVNCRRMLAYSAWSEFKFYLASKSALQAICVSPSDESYYVTRLNQLRERTQKALHAMKLMAISAQLFMPGQPLHINVYSEDIGMTWQDFFDAQDESVREQFGEALEREEVIDAMDTEDRE